MHIFLLYLCGVKYLKPKTNITMNKTETITPQFPDFGALLESVKENGRRIDERDERFRKEQVEREARWEAERKEREAKWEAERKEREARWSTARNGTPISRTRNSAWRWPPSAMPPGPKSTRNDEVSTC